MTEQELFKLGEICVQLGNSVQKCGQKYYMSQLKAIYDIVKCIDSNMDVKEKTKYILSRYKVLYPAHGGLNEFYIQDDDFATRLKLNEPLDKLKDDLWKIIKLYI